MPKKWKPKGRAGKLAAVKFLPAEIASRWKRGASRFAKAANRRIDLAFDLFPGLGKGEPNASQRKMIKRMREQGQSELFKVRKK